MFILALGSFLPYAGAALTARHSHTSTLLPDGNVLIAGGVDAAGAATAGVQMYNMATNSYDAWAGDLITARSSHTATLMSDGRVLIAGGFNAGVPLASLEICDPTTRLCAATAAVMRTARGGHTATLLTTGSSAGRALLCGGQIDALSASITGDCDIFNPYDNTAGAILSGASAPTPIPTPRMGHAAVRMRSGKIFVTGGRRWSGSAWYYETNNEIYDPQLNSWHSASALLQGRIDHSATVLNNGIIVIAGGYNSANILECAGTAGECWYLPDAPGANSNQNAGSQGYLGSAELFDPNGGKMVSISMLYRNSRYSTALMPDGAAHIFGGYGNIQPTFFSSAMTLKAGSRINRTGCGAPNVNGQVTCQLDATSVIDLQASIKLASAIDARVVDGDVFLSRGSLAAPTFTVPYDAGSSAGTAQVYMLARSTIALDGTATGKLISADNLPGDLNIRGTVPLAAVSGDIIVYSTTPANITTLEDAAYSLPTSTVVMREMIFADDHIYKPSKSTWEFGEPFSYPIFSQTTVLTPAADAMIVGGRNCEADPATDCPGRTFTARGASTAYISKYKDAAGGSNWGASEKLNTKRAFHTSTMLRTGQILTCGGSDGVLPLATCELMDPATKKWTVTGSMTTARTRHTATLLPNGTVLAAGGTTPSNTAVNTAEIYYPDTQRWVPTSPMAEARQNHTATLLPDGTVLVTGGNTLSTYSATAEIYVSSSAVWQSAGTMADSRAQHTATLLKNGNVLLTGGVNSFGALRAAEVFGYIQHAFIPAQASVMNNGRYGHTATLLRDGRVLVIGGSDNLMSQYTSELYDGTAWTPATTLHLNRANHRSVLLPNGKVMVTGGEAAGTAQNGAESYDPDFASWFEQGQMTSRSHHTTVLTTDNYILNIGGWDGTKYLDTTDVVYFSYPPDMYGLAAATARQPAISAATDRFDRTAAVTLLANTSNFHGLTEASGGGAGPMNSSYDHPRIYMQQIDNPSGFLIDLSTRIYSWYGSSNTGWAATPSSITVLMPATTQELPHGWYNMRVAANGQFSNGYTVQVTAPRPGGLTSIPTGAVLGSTSVQWTWTQDSLSASDGYAIFASSNDVFIGTTAIVSPATYVQTGLAPNTAASIKVGGYNDGGYSAAFQRSATYYTLAVAPQGLGVDAASFETASLSWDPMGNSPLTIYEISMSENPDFDPATVARPFNDALTSTGTEITGLSPNQTYYFRVRARNVDGIVTDYDNASMTATPVSTVTVGNINNLLGTPLTMSAVSWSWDPAAGADFYEAYDISAGTGSAVFLASATANSLTQVQLSTNTAYRISVKAAKNPLTGTAVRGPASNSNFVYTLAVRPLPGAPSVFTNRSTSSLTINWIPNGNPSSTNYQVLISTDINFTVIVTSNTGSGTSAVLSGVSPNTLYYADIIARNGDEVATEPLFLGSAYTKAEAPANVRATSISMSGITLAWDTGANPAGTVYEVRGTTTPGFTTGITTYIPFSRLNTAATATLNGLLTGTTYYFDVAGRNNIGDETARTQSLPIVYQGLSGAPGGLGGTSQPKSDVTIEGTLLNNRKISLLLPAGAFKDPTAITVSTYSYTVPSNPCSYLVGGSPVEVAIYTENTAQPQVPVTLKLAYTSAEADAGITGNRAKLVLARYNPLSGECLPLETRIEPCFAVEGQWSRCITAKLNHFSMFQLMVSTSAANLNAVRAYPNPFYSNRGQGFVTIDKLPASAKVRIYTLSGDKVWEGTAGTTGVLTWSAVNGSGAMVASGVYLAAIDSDMGKKILKIAVER